MPEEASAGHEPRGAPNYSVPVPFPNTPCDWNMSSRQVGKDRARETFAACLTLHTTWRERGKALWATRALTPATMQHLAILGRKGTPLKLIETIPAQQTDGQAMPGRFKKQYFLCWDGTTWLGSTSV